MIFFLDFEKASDSLEWKYLFEVLVAMNFGPRFRNRVRIFYHNISSCVVNNGYASDFFSLQKGVRQGCPLSGLLLVLAVEPLANQIRINYSIKGLKNGNKVTINSVCMLHLFTTIPRLYPYFLYFNNLADFLG